MFKKFKKLLAVGLVLVLATALLPSGLAVGTSQFTVSSKNMPSGTDPNYKDPKNMADGEIVTYSKVSGAALPSMDFQVQLSAIGQQYVTTTTTVQHFNIMLLFDVSNSMTDDRIANLVMAANGAIGNLSGNGNKIAVTTFASMPTPQRGLSSTPLQLVQSSTALKTVGGVDQVGISRRSDSSLGGTNIQAGLISAYKTLSASTDANAIPVVILLSDGAPTYYYPNVSAMNTDTTGRNGTGNSVSTDNVACTIAEAAYLKALMPKLQIYTVPFSLNSSDSDYSYANATMNPTDTNINQLYNFSASWQNAINTIPTQYRSSVTYKYANGSYSASNSASNLSAALTNIITAMQIDTPFSETVVNNVLTDSSYLTVRYQIGTGYVLSGTAITVTLGGKNYTLNQTQTGSTYTYVYQTPTTDLSYSPGIAKLTATLSSDGLITWKIPATVLPCNTPTGSNQVLVSPITLSFTLTFNVDSSGLSESSYPTSSGCSFSFAPNAYNPHYYSTTAGSTTGYTTAQWYAAQYPVNTSYYGYNAYSLPTLTGFSSASSESALESGYIQNLSGVTVNNYAEGSSDASDVMNLTYNNTPMQFTGMYQPTATATFTLNASSLSSNPSDYTVSNFNDGRGHTFSDAVVSNVSLNRYGTSVSTITVTYNGGRRSITFSKPSFSKVTNPQSSTAIFIRNDTYYDTYYYIKTLDGVNMNNYQLDYYNDFSNKSLDYDEHTLTYDINFNYNGNDYSFDNIVFSYDNDYFTTSPCTGIKTTTTYQSNATQAYYYTELNASSAAPYNLAYNNNTLTVTVSGSTAATYTASPTQTIAANDQGGYTVTQKNSDGTKTVTNYYVSNGALYKTISTIRGTNGVDLTTGYVTQTSSYAGSIVLENAKTPQQVAGQLNASLTLTSPYYGSSGYTIASSNNVADVIVVFTVGDTVTLTPSTALTLTTDPSVTLQSAQVKQVNGVDASALPATLAGTTKVLYELTFSGPPASGSTATVNFDNIKFRWHDTSSGSTYDGELDHELNYANQSVNVSFDTSSGH